MTDSIRPQQRRRAARSQSRDHAVFVESFDPDGEMVEAGLRALPDRKALQVLNNFLSFLISLSSGISCLA